MQTVVPVSRRMCAVRRAARSSRSHAAAAPPHPARPAHPDIVCAVASMDHPEVSEALPLINTTAHHEDDHEHWEVRCPPRSSFP